jgi:hypothetical protein
MFILKHRWKKRNEDEARESVVKMSRWPTKNPTLSVCDQFEAHITEATKWQLRN